MPILARLLSHLQEQVVKPLCLLLTHSLTSSSRHSRQEEGLLTGHHLGEGLACQQAGLLRVRALALAVWVQVEWEAREERCWHCLRLRGLRAAGRVHLQDLLRRQQPGEAL